MVAGSGLISVAGGKLTTFRRMAERVVDMVAERLQAQGVAAPARRGSSEAATLGSGDTGPDVDAFTARLHERWPRLDAAVIDRLVPLYGSHAERMVDAIAADPVLGERYDPSLPVTRAELEYAMREEMALTVTDFLERRSRLLLWDPDMGRSIAGGVARAMGEHLGWDASRVHDEAQRYRELAEHLRTFESSGPAAQVAHG
jgi:glycerol-3-phosphate dehydrogenase